MPLTLRQHVAQAMEILSCLGGPTILPSASNAIVRRRQRRLWMRMPKQPRVRPDVAGKRRDYALDVCRVVAENDRTGWATEYLTELRNDVAAEIWKNIPDDWICPLCFSRIAKERRDRKRRQCRACGAFVQPHSRRGLVAADLRNIRAKLRRGKYAIAKEQAERT